MNGTLTVTNIDNEITLTADSQSKVYDGQELRCNITLEGTVPDSYTWEAYTSWQNTVCYNSTALVFYHFYTAAGLDVTSYFTNVTTVSGSLTIEQLRIQIDLNGTGAPTYKFLNGPYEGQSNVCSGDGTYDIDLYTGDMIEIIVTGPDQATFYVPVNRDCYDILGSDGLSELLEAPTIDPEYLQE